ncbi:MAG: hypothetical protein R6V47_07830 [Candidatus Delongbacteria bacterium]
MSRRRDPVNDDVVAGAYPFLGYDAVGLGNQDLINGIKFFKNKMNGKLPFVSCNIDFKDDDIKIDKYRIVETTDGIRVGVTAVNYSTDFRHLYRTNTIKEDEIEVSKAFDELRPVLKELRKRSDLIVVLANLNEAATARLLDDVDGYDMVVGGNNMTSYKFARIVNNKIHVQPGRDGEKIGKSVFKINDDGDVEFSGYELIKVHARKGGYKRNEEIDKIIIELKNK